MCDVMPEGRRFRTFNVVDDFNREVLHIEVDSSNTYEQLTRIIQRLQAEHGLPQVVRTDNGPEFLGQTITEWSGLAGMAIQYMQPAKPNQDVHVERFSRTSRDELLDLHLLKTRDDVRQVVHWWMIEYNEERPDDAPNDLTPLEACQQSARNSTYEPSP